MAGEIMQVQTPEEEAAEAAESHLVILAAEPEALGSSLSAGVTKLKRERRIDNDCT